MCFVASAVRGYTLLLCNRLNVFPVVSQEFVEYMAQFIELFLKGAGIGAHFLLLVQDSNVEGYHGEVFLVGLPRETFAIHVLLIINVLYCLADSLFLSRVYAESEGVPSNNHVYSL